jgi:type VI secretion system protein ImpG
MFYRLSGLQEACKRCVEQEMDIFFLFDHAVPELERRVDQSHARLFCSPAINLFDKRMDPIYLEDRFSEFHVVPDKNRPQDFEIYDVTRVEGLGSRRDSDQEFLPFYRTHHGTPGIEGGAYYTVNRRPRRFSAREKKSGPRSSYHGSEVFISLVDSNSRPYHPDLKQLHVDGRCTNRDLPLEMPRGAYSTDFTVEDQAPVASVRCLSGPTRPRPSVCEGEEAWQAVSHLSLNYLSLADTEGGKGAEALKEILLLYCPDQNSAREKQIQGISDITTEPIVRRISGGVPPAFARGLQVQVRLQEEAFEGTGPFLLGAVLERFFAEYASINSFTETVIETSSRGEIKRWPLRTGKKNSL